MALSLQNALIAHEKSRKFSRDAGIFYALKSFFMYWSADKHNADIQLISFAGSDVANPAGFDSGISEPHRLYVVWGKKGTGTIPSYLVVYDQAASGSFGSGPPLGDAQRFAVLGATTDTNTGPTVIVGDLGLYPGTSITGFPPGTVSGEIHATDPTALRGQNALTTLYNALAALPSTETLAPGVVIGSGGTRPSFGPGVYDWATAGQLTGTVTLTGNATDVFVFRAGSTMTTASASAVVLAGGALPQNVFWKAGSSVTLGTTTAFQGVAIALASVTANTGATVRGRLFARTGAVTMDSNTISASGGSGLSSPADGRKSLPFLEAGREDIEIIPNGIPIVTNTVLKAYTAFAGLTSSEIVDAPRGFIIVGHPTPPTY